MTWNNGSPLKLKFLRIDLTYIALERMMKRTILKGIAAMILMVVLFPALSTAQSTQNLYSQYDQDPYKALQEQLNGYQRADEQKRRAQDQEQKAYKDWILGGPPPKSQKSDTPPPRYRPPVRTAPPQNTQRGAGYGNQQRPRVQSNNGTTRRTQPSARAPSGKKPAGFSMDNYNRAMGNPAQSQKPSGLSVNPSRGRGLDRLRAGEVQKITPQKKPTKYCSCRGDDWNEFDVMCQPLGNATNHYPPGYFPWTSKCHRVVWK